ncbi:MAG: aspartate kinase [Myxococcota bacterium]|nr:aspartate kinase [Myxococcota bacterium]
MLVVQKYGGSSVASVERIRQVARRVAKTTAEGCQVVVVVSAMGNTTNELLNLARQVSPTPGRRELDLLVSVGERVSMTLLAMAVQDLGVPAASFTGSQSGIITDDHHVAARVVEVRPHRILRALGEGKVVIVAGFQGVSAGGEVTTLGRGGSDTTAVVLAAALRADHCEICSDVDGVYTADPRVVPEATRVTELSTGGAGVLAAAGSKVLLSEAVQEAARLGVDLVASSTTGTPGDGTRVSQGPVPMEPFAVARRPGLRHVFIATGPGEDSLDSLTGALHFSVDVGDGRHFLLDWENHHDAATGLPGEDRGSVDVVSIVGQSVTAEASLLQRYRSVLQPHGYRFGWAQGATWSGVVPSDSGPEAERALHGALTEPGSK